MLPTSRIAAVVFALGLLSTPALADTVIYREIFPNDNSSNAADIARSQGWFANQHGNPYAPAGNTEAQVSTLSGAPGMATPVGSNPVGPTADTGFLFYSPSARAGIYLYTTEIGGVSADALQTVSWESRNSTFYDANWQNLTGDARDKVTDSFMHLAIRINGEWYVSDAANAHTLGSSTWQSQSIGVRSTLWTRFDDYNMGESGLPRNLTGAEDLNLLLPSGTVDAIGLWINKNQPSANNQAQIRIDNFTVTAVPEPLTGVLLTAGLATLLRRRSRR